MNRRDLLLASMGVAGVGDSFAASDVSATSDLATVQLTLAPERTLGSAAVIGDLIGSQYEPYTFGYRQPDAWGVAAWREVGFNVSDIGLFNYEGSDPNTVSGKIVGIHVTRNAVGKPVLDFADFDRNIAFMRDELRVEKIDFTCWGTPRALADATAGNTFFFHAPANYDEWAEILGQAVRHIRSDLGLAGSSYKTWTEPETGYYWRGRAREGRIIRSATDAEPTWKRIGKDWGTLDDYVEKYVRDWHTIKGADPGAKVGGPFTVYSKPIDVIHWSVEQFLQKIAAHNRTTPAAAVTVDELVYQDYNWHGNGLSEGVIAATLLLRKFGLPDNTPLVLAGWNNGMKNDQSPQHRAAFIVSNIMRELVPTGRPRRLSRAYLWPFDYDYYGDGIAPVIMPFRAVTYSGDDGSDSPISNAAITTYRKRPTHAALKLLSLMKGGELIDAHSNSRDVVVLASAEAGGRLQWVAVNDSVRSFRVDTTLLHRPQRPRSVRLTLRRVDAAHSADGAGLEAGECLQLTMAANGRLPVVDLPRDAVVGFTLEIL